VILRAAHIKPQSWQSQHRIEGNAIDLTQWLFVTRTVSAVARYPNSCLNERYTISLWTIILMRFSIFSVLFGKESRWTSGVSMYRWCCSPSQLFIPFSLFFSFFVKFLRFCFHVFLWFPLQTFSSAHRRISRQFYGEIDFHPFHCCLPDFLISSYGNLVGPSIPSLFSLRNAFAPKMHSPFSRIAWCLTFCFFSDFSYPSAVRFTYLVSVHFVGLPYQGSRLPSRLFFTFRFQYRQQTLTDCIASNILTFFRSASLLSMDT
jgi:hypothetical protein